MLQRGRWPQNLHVGSPAFLQMFFLKFLKLEEKKKSILLIFYSFSPDRQLAYYHLESFLNFYNLWLTYRTFQDWE